MIAKVCPRGRRVAGLLRYLYATGPAQQEGRGRRNPHLDPRLVAGFDEPDELEPAVTPGGRDFRRLVALLVQPLAAAGVGPDKRPVYHLVVAAKNEPDTGTMVDRYLSDEARHRRDLPGPDRPGAPRGRPRGALGGGAARR